MLLLLIVFAICLAFGLFFIIADILKIPYMSTSKAIINTGKKDRKSTKSTETVMLELAGKVSKFVKLNEYKRSRLQSVLKAADMNITPETYMSCAYLKVFSILIFIIPSVLIFPLIVPIIIFFAIAVYFKEVQKADAKLREKREEIESELPRFVATIEQELKNSRDVLGILENFKKNAGKKFGQELDIVCADMRSSSYEAAMTRFEARINSPQLSDIVRGLIGVLRGDDGSIYFQLLAYDFKQMELRKLKAEAEKIPPKIKVFSFVMLVCFLFTYLAIIGFEILKSLGTMM